MKRRALLLALGVDIADLPEIELDLDVAVAATEETPYDIDQLEIHAYQDAIDVTSFNDYGIKRFVSGGRRKELRFRLIPHKGFDINGWIDTHVHDGLPFPLDTQVGPGALRANLRITDVVSNVSHGPFQTGFSLDVRAVVLDAFEFDDDHEPPVTVPAEEAPKPPRRRGIKLSGF